MKEATGELSMTVVTIIAVVAIIGIVSMMKPFIENYINDTFTNLKDKGAYVELYELEDVNV